MRRYHRGKIKNGKFESDKQKFKDSMASMPDGDYLWCLISTQDRTPNDWRAYYFAILGEWSMDTGHTKDELHSMVKQELFSELFKGLTSTNDLTNDEWNILLWNLENYLILKFENR